MQSIRSRHRSTIRWSIHLPGSGSDATAQAPPLVLELALVVLSAPFFGASVVLILLIALPVHAQFVTPSVNRVSSAGISGENSFYSAAVIGQNIVFGTYT